MYPKQHIFLGFIFSVVLFVLFPSIEYYGAGIVFLSSFLIDFDHYLYYAIKEKTINPFRAVKYFFDARKKVMKMPKNERKKYYSGFCFLHGIEILILLIIFGFIFSRLFFLIFMGFTFHLMLDMFEQINNKSRIDKISVIYDFIKYKKLRKINV